MDSLRPKNYSKTYCFGPPEGAHNISRMKKEHTGNYVEK